MEFVPSPVAIHVPETAEYATEYPLVAKMPTPTTVHVAPLFASSPATSVKKKLVPELPVPVRPLSSLVPGIYSHGTDFVVNLDLPVHLMFIDPGHAHPMVGVCQPAGHAVVDRSAGVYRLSNRRYREMTGMTNAKRKRDKIRYRDVAARAAFHALSQASAKVTTSDAYLDHVQCLVTHWTALFHHAFIQRLREIRMQGYSAKQRAMNHIVSEISAHFPASSSVPTVLVVGNGCNTATSRGYDSAPGKALRRRLARDFVILMSSEYRSSRRSPCCQTEVRHGHFDGRAKRKDGRSKCGDTIRGLFHCRTCRTPFDRDVAAAHNIASIFHHHVTTRSSRSLFADPVEA